MVAGLKMLIPKAWYGNHFLVATSELTKNLAITADVAWFHCRLKPYHVVPIFGTGGSIPHFSHFKLSSSSWCIGLLLMQKVRSS